jgi:hypothetical protein
MVNFLAGTDSRRWLLGSLLFVLFRTLPNFSYPIGRDQASFLVIGEGLLRGQRLYRDLWDVHPSGIYAPYAVLSKLFGHVMWSVGFVDIIWLLAISYCIFRFTERYMGSVAAAVTVVVNASWHCAYGYLVAAESECFLMLLVFAGYFLVTESGRWQSARDLAAGLCLGGGFWLKYNALAFLPLLALVPYVDWSELNLRPRRLRLVIPRGEWLRRAGVLIAGFLIAFGAVVAYFGLTGSWAAFRESYLPIAPRYVAAPGRIPGFWTVTAARVLLGVGGWTLLAILVSFLIPEWCDLSQLLPIASATAMGFAATSSQLRFFPYYFETCRPFLAAIWGYLAWRVYSDLRALARQPNRRWISKLLTSALLLVIALGPLRAEAKTCVQRYRDLAWWWRDSRDYFARYPEVRSSIERLEGQSQVIDLLRRCSVPGDGLFIWGTAPLIYYMTGLRPPTRFVVTNLPLVCPWGLPEWRDELMRDLHKSPPAFLVVAQGDAVPDIALSDLDSEQYLSRYPSLAGFISAAYDRMADVPGFVVYRRKSPGPIPVIPGGGP